MTSYCVVCRRRKEAIDFPVAICVIGSMCMACAYARDEGTQGIRKARRKISKSAKAKESALYRERNPNKSKDRKSVV